MLCSVKSFSVNHVTYIYNYKKVLQYQCALLSPVLRWRPCNIEIQLWKVLQYQCACLVKSFSTGHVTYRYNYEKYCSTCVHCLVESFSGDHGMASQQCLRLRVYWGYLQPADLESVGINEWYVFQCKEIITSTVIRLAVCLYKLMVLMSVMWLLRPLHQIAPRG